MKAVGILCGRASIVLEGERKSAGSAAGLPAHGGSLAACPRAPGAGGWV